MIHNAEPGYENVRHRPNQNEEEGIEAGDDDPVGDGVIHAGSRAEQTAPNEVQHCGDYVGGFEKRDVLFPDLIVRESFRIKAALSHVLVLIRKQQNQIRDHLKSSFLLCLYWKFSGVYRERRQQRRVKVIHNQRSHHPQNEKSDQGAVYEMVRHQVEKKVLRGSRSGREKQPLHEP